MGKKHNKWSPYFIQLMRDTLPLLGLEVQDHVKLGRLPLEADLVLITLGKKRRWKSHPLWQHLVHTNVVEFKSVGDPLVFGEFEKLLAYTLLYRLKYKVPYTRDLSAWLLVPTVTPTLKKALGYYKIKLQAVLPGFWWADVLFPLYVVEYAHLPHELPYAELKLFLKSGKPVQEILKLVLQSEKNEIKVKQILATTKEIHPDDLKELTEMKGKTAAHKSLEKAMWEFTREQREKEIKKATKEAAKEAEQRLANVVCQMKAKGFDHKLIAELTGLSLKKIADIEKR